MTQTNQPPPASILVVDDEENNRTLLADCLELSGYHAVGVADGPAALKALQHDAFDLVLLDIMMPGMDGYEVCRRIRAMPGLQTLPVLMVTALDGEEEQVQGLDAGADDFVSKPIQRDVLLARVRAQLRKRSAHRDSASSLERQNDELRERGQRAQDLTSMVVHDMKSPLSALSMSLGMLQDVFGEVEGVGQDTLNNMSECTDRLASMVSNMLSVQRMRERELELHPRPFSFGRIFDTSLSYQHAHARRQGIELTVTVAPGCDRIFGNAELIARVVENLLSNAIRFAPRESELQVAVSERADGQSLLTVSDRGPGIPDGDLESIFEMFATSDPGASSPAVNRGLGLTFCRMAVEAHGGRIWVESREGGGSRFCFTLPPAPAAEEAEDLVSVGGGAGGDASG